LITGDTLEKLAQADEHEVVKTVQVPSRARAPTDGCARAHTPRPHLMHRSTRQEHFADYYAINQDVFSLNLPPPMPSDPSSRQVRVASPDRLRDWLTHLSHSLVRVCQLYIEKITNGLGSLLLSFNMNPVIRFEKASPMCQSVAQELAVRRVRSGSAPSCAARAAVLTAPCVRMQRRIGQEHGLFDTNRKRGGTAPLLLIIDRFSDPVTPLLCQWTYQVSPTPRTPCFLLAGSIALSC